MMDIGTDMIGMVKTNKKRFCKEIIEKMTNNWLGCSYLVLMRKAMVTGDRPKIAKGYKYNAQKVLYFIGIEVAGSTKSVLPYLIITLTCFLMFPFSLLFTPF